MHLMLAKLCQVYYVCQHLFYFWYKNYVGDGMGFTQNWALHYRGVTRSSRCITESPDISWKAYYGVAGAATLAQGLFRPSHHCPSDFLPKRIYTNKWICPFDGHLLLYTQLNFLSNFQLLLTTACLWYLSYNNNSFSDWDWFIICILRG